MATNNNNTILDTYKKALTTAASFAASAMLARTVINEFLPHELQNYIYSTIGGLRTRLSSEHTIVIEQNEGYNSNMIYDAVKTYLSTRINPTSKRLRASMVEEGKAIVISLEAGEEMIDVYQGIEFKWQLCCREIENTTGSRNSETRSFELYFDKKHKDIAVESYLPFIVSSAKSIKEMDRTLQLYMNDMDCWSAINLHHPSTFETLAMDSKLKQSVMDDLARFVKRKDYYKKIGKAWKRGYLLYGPPGTGKSSLIAAMANYLKFDIYDLELTEVKWNSTLRRLLVGMSNRCILVIEDIDCSIEIQKRDDTESTETTNPSSSDDDKITLSGLLNFVDGLWSTSGEERIIVFTTNYKERLDPALLRPGRMDMHVHMGYCSAEAFRVLASNYHAIDDHPMFSEIEELIERVVEVTPAEIAEELMKSDDTEIALQGVVAFLKGKSKSKVASDVTGNEEHNVNNNKKE